MSDCRVGLKIWGLFAALATTCAQPLSAQDPDMSFFVALDGPGWGADQSALEVGDQHCRDLAYEAGFGDGTWRAYLSADGETARDRIGPGPFVNWYGAVVAESVEQLHSDDSGLTRNTAATQTGEGPIPEELLAIPAGSQLSGDPYSRDGPFFCFKLP